eukprot:15366468-Ditylum_brightwellii.AAC.1
MLVVKVCSGLPWSGCVNVLLGCWGTGGEKLGDSELGGLFIMGLSNNAHRVVGNLGLIVVDVKDLGNF